MSRRRLAAVGLTALVVALFAAACSSGSDNGAEISPVTSDATVAEQIQPQPDPVQPLASDFTEPKDGTIEIHISDGKFVQNKLSIPAGQPVKIRVINDDNQQHNLRIAGFDGKYQTEDDAITSPDTIQPGSSGELTFAPPVPGAYTFRCDFFPGSMGGQIVVH